MVKLQKKWLEEPISCTCEVAVGSSPQKLCDKATSLAYPAMGGGWMALCYDHGKKHLPGGAFFTDFLIIKGRQVEMKWQTSIMSCNACGAGWIGVHQVTCEYLECPQCGHMNPAPFIEGSECGPCSIPATRFQKLKRTIRSFWCLLNHQAHHEVCRSGHSHEFFKCRKCGLQHARSFR